LTDVPIIRCFLPHAVVFDQMHWGYSATTWSEYSLTATMGVFHPDTPQA